MQLPNGETITDDEIFDKKTKNFETGLDFIQKNGKLVRKDVPVMDNFTEDIYKFTYEKNSYAYHGEEQVMHAHVFRDSNNKIILMADIIAEAQGEDQHEFYAVCKHVLSKPELWDDYADDETREIMEVILNKINGE